MPKIGQSNNGTVGKPKSAIVKKIEDRLRGTDPVKIGLDDYEYKKEDDSSSWAKLAEEIDAIRWLVPQWIPYGMLTGVIAEPKLGKSAWVLWAIVRPIITKCNWFTGHPGPKDSGIAIWCDTERRAAVNLTRAKKWGLPIESIKTPFPDDPKRPIDLENSMHIDRLYDVVCRYKAKLVVVDSFRGAHKGSENDSKIAATLQNLAGIAEDTNAAICLIHHTHILAEGDEVTFNSARGSNAFLAMVACQIAIDRPEGPKADWRRVQILGENLGTAPQPFGFRFTDTGLEFGSAPDKARKKTQKDDAEAWLRQRLQPGETYKASDILTEALQYDHSERTTRKAATERLGIVPKPVRKDGRIAEWDWVLPVHGELHD